MHEAIRESILRYVPWNGQEKNDRLMMLKLLETTPDIFLRENQTAHFTASSWIVSPKRDQVLMAYHNIYQAWAWSGGHADGEEDLLSVALREAEEETGVHARPITKEIYSLEILTVDGHEKRGKYVSSHLHLNVTYLLEADPGESVRIKADENSGIRWFSLKDAVEKCGEKWMGERIYSKLNAKLKR